VGTAIHLMMQNDFHAMAKRSAQGQATRLAQNLADDMNCVLEFEDEAKVHPSLQPLAAHYKLYSSADGIFTFRDRDTQEVKLRVGLEIKTESPDEYAKLKDVKAQHLRQGHLYMACLDLPLMWFFYMNKGNQNNTNSKAPYLVAWQPAIWAELEGRFQTILDHAARGELPERTPTIVCEFCPWSYTCEPPQTQRQNQRPPTRRDTIRT
jgi:hypothetical protein